MVQNQIRTLLLGTNNFAAEVFNHLSKFDFIKVVGVVTQADKKFGRKALLNEPPVKSDFYNKLNKKVKLYQPLNFKLEYKEILKGTKPDLIIVCAYGKILPKDFIDFPKFKSLNIHASLLPSLRGATPIQSAVLKRLSKTGVTLQVMSEKMDEGDIIAQKEIEIDNTTITTPELFDILTKLTFDLLDDSLDLYLKKEILPVPQEGTPTYCYISDFEYEKGRIDFKNTAIEIDAKIRAFNPNPGCWLPNITIQNTEGLNLSINKKIKLIECSLVQMPMLEGTEIGIVKIISNELYLKCLNGCIQIKVLQTDGSKKIDAKSFINGLKFVN